MKNKAKIAVLVSGGGTNLQALIDAQSSGIISSGYISVVVSGKAGAYALQRAENAGIATETLPRSDYADAVGYSRALGELLAGYDIDLVVLAGFMSILTPEFIDLYPDRIINVHPSLIPSFCGEGCFGIKVHQMALDYGVKVSGATVHFVSQKVDGGRIIAQKAAEVLEGDTPETLQRRIMEQCEWVILPRAVEQLCRKISENK